MTNLEAARAALADIAFSDDMTLEVAKAKARRVYESTADEPTCAHSDMRRVDGHLCEGCGGYRPLDEPDGPLQHVRTSGDV